MDIKAPEYLVMLVSNSEPMGSKLKESKLAGSRWEPSQGTSLVSLRSVLLLLSPPMHSLVQGLQQLLLIVADIVMCQAKQLVCVLWAVRHFCVVVWGVGRREVDLPSCLLCRCPPHPWGENAA